MHSTKSDVLCVCIFPSTFMLCKELDHTKSNEKQQADHRDPFRYHLHRSFLIPDMNRSGFPIQFQPDQSGIRIFGNRKQFLTAGRIGYSCFISFVVIFRNNTTVISTIYIKRIASVRMLFTCLRLLILSIQPYRSTIITEHRLSSVRF